MKIITRKSALDLGLKHYFTGKPCPRGHVCNRYTSAFACVDCCAENSAFTVFKHGGPKKRHHLHFCEIARAAMSSNTRSEFKNNFPSEYMAASKKGILNRITLKMPPPKTRGIWSKDTCKNEALKYKTRSLFCESSSGAYEAAARLGILECVCAHMNRPLTDADVVYIWGQEFLENFVCKVGITSKRLGDWRIGYVNNKSPISCEFSYFRNDKNARKVEQKILSIGSPVNVGNFDGSTEFRVFSKTQMMEIKIEYFNS